MKNLWLVFTLLIIIGSCQQKKKDSVDGWTSFEADTTVNDEESTLKEIGDYQVKFERVDTALNVTQILAVTWILDNSIEFRMEANEDECVSQYWGQAKIRYAEMDPEIDQDHIGESYPSFEYVQDRDALSIRIRISVDRERAKVIFVEKTKTETDCYPTSNLLLVDKG